ncbi:hexameric tyrosine-coordinated heme protein [Pseudonocardia sp.]|uniref:hexameric tyrosine-coordinated heme protein n=1 Tax=Pseudonocardia sp. TaxID=60912 RepID=UPI003D0FFB56
MTDTFELVPGGSLKTSSPEEGRELAVQLSRRTIRLTQPHADEREKLRAEYALDSMALLIAAQVVATEFATIAAANDYWM